MVKTKVLWMSETPTIFTGFGTVTREVLSRLSRNDRYHVACLGWGYDGWPYNRQEFPYDIYPSTLRQFGSDTLPRALEEFQPDVLISYGDIWMIDWVADLPHRDKFKSVVYFPVDGEPLYPSWGTLIRNADVPITCSFYGQQVIRTQFPDVKTKTIYHGVDTNTFHPLDKDSLKRQIGLEGKFIVGCVARNQPRKHLPILIKAFAKFSQGKEDVALYLHTNPEDIGWDVLDLIKRYGIESRTLMSKYASVTKGVSGDKLNEIYNLFDVMVLPSGGEGFGLPIIESFAAGVPVIATGYSACVELVEGRGELIEVKDFVTQGKFNVEHAIPDVDSLVEKLELLYGDTRLRDNYGESGLKFARTLDWNDIVAQWDDLLSNIIST